MDFNKAMVFFVCSRNHFLLSIKLLPTILLLYVIIFPEERRIRIQQKTFAGLRRFFVVLCFNLEKSLILLFYNVLYIF